MIAAFASSILIALALGLLRRRRYRASFRIPSRRQDSYCFRAATPALPVSVGKELHWPDARLRSGSSAFLALDVTASAAGHIVDPYIEFRAGAVSARQYFERAVAGRRYLNLSGVLQRSSSTPATVRLEGRHLNWNKSAELHVFDPPSPSSSTVVLSPHPDDSELAAFGYYSGRHSWVVTLTAGERSPTDLSALVEDDLDRCRWLARLRVWDSLTVPRLGGVAAHRCLNLACPDTRLSEMRTSPAKGFRLRGEDGSLRLSLRSSNRLSAFRKGGVDCNWNDLVADLKRVLDLARPDTVVCPHPLIDPHPDHVHTAIALADALRDGARPPAAILLYVVHANEAPIYPFGDAKSIVSLPPGNDPEWIADSIYSHPLSEDTRCAKFFSVEAAHDLRTYSACRAPSLRDVTTALRRDVSDFLTGMRRPGDFLRRAPRPNEVFFVASVGSFLELAHRATQREMRRRQAWSTSAV